MKIQAQTSAAFTQLADLVEHLPVAMLTTQNEHGQLVSRPMSPLELDSAGAFWFFTDVKSSKVDQLHHLNLSFSSAEKSTYVSICGKGDIVLDPARNEALWTVFARPWFPDGSTSADLALLKVTPYTAEIWDSPSSKMVQLFALAASVVAGKPVGMGDHDTLKLTKK